jgi:hypothetical protein
LKTMMTLSRKCQNSIQWLRNVCRDTTMRASDTSLACSKRSNFWIKACLMWS